MPVPPEEGREHVHADGDAAGRMNPTG